MKDGDRIKAALEVAKRYGQTDEGHHKAWVIDQMVRALTEGDYEDWVFRVTVLDGKIHYAEWDTGIAP